LTGHVDRVTFRFPSEGITLVGDLYLPTGDSPSPAVVTAPGFAGVKEMLIPQYATALADAGIACLAFDHPHFGASEGEPRQHLDPRRQVRAFQHALDALELDGRVAPGRLGAWGTSMSGGHTLTLAATDPRIRCAVAHIPFIANRGRPPAWLAGQVVKDAARRIAGLSGTRTRVTGPPGCRALMTTDGAEDFIATMTTHAPGYVNHVTTASLLAVQRYDTSAAAAALAVPLRVTLATNDTITPAAQVRAALGRWTGRPGDRPLDVVEFPETHFEVFGTHLQRTVELTVDWFVQHLA
jgi:fermentation-respiration switch protein FrsA (DUF1100 family)